MRSSVKAVQESKQREEKLRRDAFRASRISWKRLVPTGRLLARVTKNDFGRIIIIRAFSHPSSRYLIINWNSSRVLILEFVACKSPIVCV